MQIEIKTIQRWTR